MTSITVIVATHNRPRLLANRALASIARQTRPPDILVIVDDSDRKTRRVNEEIVADFRAEGTKTVYLENYRTPGAAGAWNTALSELQDTAPATFVAILDDDDSWDPSYLQRCEEAVSERDLDMVASGFFYHETAKHEGWPLASPDRLDVNDLLIRNPHIQGSNLFVRLRKLLEAGGFDEAMVSTTDRDVCIRLADLGTVRYGDLGEYLVHHYAESDRIRLSTPGGDAKCAGLRHFFRKYHSRMSHEQRAAFLERSRETFDCDANVPVQLPPPAGPVPRSPDDGEHMHLFVGAITSPEVGRVANLIDELIHKIDRRSDVTLMVILLENGGHDQASKEELRAVVERASRRGLNIEVKTLEEQGADTESGVFAATKEQLSERKSIALSRTMLQHYLFLEAKPRQGAVVWVLDDDALLEGLCYGADGVILTEDVDYVSAIKRLKKTDSCVVLGEVTGEPPLPFLSCVRTQIVDLYHNLHQMAALRPDYPYPDRRDENRLVRLNHRDYYYDLSRVETDHLESPFWYEPSEKGLRVKQVFQEMVARLPDTLSGSQVFRPLVRTEHFDSASGLVPSVNRGPTTLVFDLQALREFPNTVPTIDGSDTRRSDMIWSLFNRFIGGCKIVKAPLPIRQDRGEIVGSGPDFGTLAQDIHGYALYSSMHDIFLQKTQRRQREGKSPYGRGLLDFGDADVVRAIGLYRKYIRERSRSFELSFHRIVGTISALRPFYDREIAGNHPPWWLGSPEHDASVARLRSFVETLESIYTQAQLDEFKQIVPEIDADSIEQYFRSLPDIAARHRSNTPLPKEGLRQAATTYVEAEFGIGPLRCLGIGDEGVVLTDGRLTYKYFHYWKSRNRERQIAFLQSLEGKLSGYSALIDILEVRRRGDHVVIVQPYVSGTKYKGGRLDGLLTLLRECRDAGIACRNIHPDNLLVTESGVKLIDYGSDIVPASDDDFEQMCRRTFLTYRFYFRSDLKRLMTKALTDSTLPELTGLDRFKNALDPRGLEGLFYRPMARLVDACRPTSALDYGCGDGQLSERISQKGIAVTAYDPDTSAIAKCREYGSQVEYGGSVLLDALISNYERFDVVVCGRVLCTILDPTELHAVLQDLRRMVTDSGTVFVAVCNPFYLSVTHTELAEKHLPAGYDYDETFTYTKTLRSNGERREDVHRSFATYVRTFTNAGLSVDEVLELDSADTRSLGPASDHLVFRLSPADDAEPRVSLLIKTCLMEWRIIERLVRHHVRQLEEPVRFVEKIVVVDPFEGPFLRQYEEPNPEAHRHAMERLVKDGIVDRVVYVPQAPETVRNTFRKWFGVESDETHSKNGQQLFATLFGFDACIGDYVLQLDSDMLIARSDRKHDYLNETVDVLRRDPKGLFVPLSICRSGPLPYTPKGPKGDWRVEVRGCLFDRRRVESILPIANELEDGRFTMAWHRAFDCFIASSEYRSYRGGDPKTASIHVMNDRKTDGDGLLDIVNSVEQGHVPPIQLESVDLVGSATDWAGPKRSEPFVFVICGRNVDPARFKHCFESLIAQKNCEWGAIVVDDASTNGFGDYAAMLLTNYADRITLVRNETRRGALYNTWNAVTRICIDPQTVIITLDADDALIGDHVLDRVRAEYEEGADVTVGSMLRLDKEFSYPVDFDNPRSWGSNVWQHLRTFKRYLFDAINVEDLKLDGEWIDLANDWAFMVPIVEMASSPRCIPQPIYLHEPSTPNRQVARTERDSIVARILAKPRYSRLERPMNSSQASRAATN